MSTPPRAGLPLRTIRRSRFAFASRTGCALALCLLLIGCITGRQTRVALPARHSIRADQLLMVSDFKIDNKHPLVEDLIQLRQQISQALSLPMGSRPVMVYVFSTEQQYRQYWEATYPGFDLRRAYFVQTPGKELAVYTAWGDKIQEDLRHEYTHGLLHASLESVPLWLDEGLAEYFEVISSQPGQVNSDYVRLLGLSLSNGWRPDLRSLEDLESVNAMRREHYREAWAWVHYMLHGSDEGREVLLSYLRELRTNPNPGRLSDRLMASVPGVETRLISYVATLGTTGGLLHASDQDPASGGLE